MGITFYQERKTERALEALRELASPRAQVWRDGEWQFVPGREVVLGDLVRLKEGDRVPADAALLKSSNLMADESLLTGESVPVRKRATRGRGGGGAARRRRSALRLLGNAAHSGTGLARVVAPACTRRSAR
jgi:Ca2+-transporting ATPase